MLTVPVSTYSLVPCAKIILSAVVLTLHVISCIKPYLTVSHCKKSAIMYINMNW